MACYVVTLPDGEVVRIQADKRPTPEVAQALAELLRAAHRRLSEGSPLPDAIEKESDVAGGARAATGAAGQ